MARTDRTLSQRIADWTEAYEAVRHEVTTQTMRQTAATMEKIENGSELQAYVVLARVISANDRAAGVIAAMLTQSGVSRPLVNVEGEGDES